MTRLPVVVLAALLAAPSLAVAQHQHGSAGAAKSVASDSQKIQSAMSAAPASISRHAAIMDWPDAPTGKPRPLRAGSNGWVCYPSTPSTLQGASGEDPMCIDEAWQSWAAAWVARTSPSIGGAGIAYMLHGDKGVSNTDPFATGPTADNHWIKTGPHVMVLLPDPKLLDSYPTDPNNGGPFVMWKGTPYAHIMVPVTSVGAAPAARKK